MSGMFFVVVVVTLLGSTYGDVSGKTKPFGLGQGPAYIGGRSTDAEGTELSLRIYGWYVNYLGLTNRASQADRDHYATYFTGNSCEGGCPGYSHCQSGICVCNFHDSMTQLYGRCVSNSTAYFSDSNELKYRKPKAPPIPDECYRTKENGGKEIDPYMRNNPLCKKVTYPNNFDSNSQYCDFNEHNPGVIGNQQCLGYDINMLCNGKRRDIRNNQERPICQCRKDMKFDTTNMECRLYLAQADCSVERRDGFTNEHNVTELLKGEMQLQPGQTLDEALVRQAFCILLDDQVEAYTSHIVGAFGILGLSAGAFFAVCCGSICAACCCCKCCEKVRAKIRALDPRTHVRNMAPETQLAAIGAVAANEYMENKNDSNDQARIAAMQGGVPAGAPQGYPGYPQGGGYPMPGGPGGYAPVPTGYGPAQQGYGQQPVYPQMAQQGGYIPPENSGMLGDAMNYAPEAAMAAGGLFTGNKQMAGLGMLAAADKFDHSDDREDAIKAAALRGVPPPPMGYAGGAPLPVGEAPPGMNMPPPTANYPRQAMQ